MLAAPQPTAIFKALADPTRVRILHLLRGGPQCVGDLAAVLAISQPKASRHLAYLKRAGLVVDERRGLWCFYGLAQARAGYHRKLLQMLDALAAGSRQSAGDDAALRRLSVSGGCCPQHAATRRKGRTR
jgi:ArsR family transcriptional regulator, arsenate/arsenite/antimonite-responsive transcriptional repressor